MKMALDYDACLLVVRFQCLKHLEKGILKRPLFLSLEQRMGCGIGACFACVVMCQMMKQSTKYRKVCSDGPVFAAGEVVLA